MTKEKKLWMTLVGVLVVTFTIFGFFGREVYRQAPPIPEKIVSENGETIFTKSDIETGQMVWQSMGGQQVGSIWGHGAYQAPDWSADWLHRELVTVLNFRSQKAFGVDFDSLNDSQKASLKAGLEKDYKENTYNSATENLVISEERVKAIEVVSGHYLSLFGNTPELQDLRENYAIQENIIPSLERREKMMAFFYWASWACATNRPNQDVTYTNNWPHEELIGNVPTTANLFWSIISIIILLIGIGSLVWYLSFKKKEDEETVAPKTDPFDNFKLTPSMKALWKYCFVIIALFLVQVFLGAALAHYTVEGQEFYGIALAEFLPYSLARTWHLQTALFWIATSFLTAGLFLAPVINGGKDPKFQKLGVNILFGALLVVVGGSLTGEYFAIHQKLDLEWSFLIGHQGYEYIDLGRVWQIGLFTGLLVWLSLMLNAIVPALKKNEQGRSLLILFTLSATAIGLFYGAGFFYGAKTHLSVMEYWRWWVVHLWVEGFFEVFATVALAFIFTKLGLINPKSAVRSALASTSIFLVGGIPGTFHHLYFSGTPIAITAVGACFSALEVVPLLLIGLEAKETLAMRDKVAWMQKYASPIKFFIGVAFWNLVGAGIFGFLINPPIALYYMQGLNTTAVHAHAATFGVYGLLSLGLVLLVLRRLQPQGVWKESLVTVSFWSMNIGLGLMIGLSLLPIGLMQTWASVETGLWFARSSEFLQTDIIETLRWMRLIGDAVFIYGVLVLAYFVVGLKFGWSFVESHSPKTKVKGKLAFQK
ncbi:MAG: nitric-oxide reductase large subunit [Calditrichaeota bacterium]|nr:MAG: nitric-oxide reductase large subunit [Calditrichota bacterium]